MTHALDLSGVAVHIHSLVKALADRGIEFHVAARELDPGKPFGLEYFQRAGITAHRIDFPGYGLNLANARKGRRARRDLDQLIRRVGIELLHIHAPTLTLVARGPCRRNRIPYLTTFNIAVTGSNKIKLARLAHKIMRNPFGEVAVGISREMAAQLVSRLHVPSERVRHIPYVTEETSYSPATPELRAAARRTFGLASDDFVLAVVAAYESRKNHELIFDAVARCIAAGRRVVVLCAGSDYYNDRPRLEKLAGDRGISEQVKLLGFAKAVDVFHASDAAALTSFSEGFPLAVVEAMHCGLPILRTPAEGAAEQVRDGRNGFIVPFGRPDALAQALMSLAADPALRLKMGEESREIAVQDYTLAAMGARMEELYAEAIAAYRRESEG